MALPTASTQDTAALGDVLVPLSPLDAVMGAIGLTVVYVFPPPAAGQMPYDLERVHAALVATIEEDYPHFVGKRFVKPVTGAVGILQTTATRAAGAKGIRFFKDIDCQLTTPLAVDRTPVTFLPQRGREEETLTLKATRLRDGGLALGLNATHALLDGEGVFTFFNVWSLHYRGVPKSERLVVNHDRHLLMPRGTGFIMEHPEFASPVKKPLNMPAIPIVSGPAIQQNTPTTVQKPFHLTPAQLKKLKEAVSRGLVDGQYVSTIDIVTAFFTVLITQARGHGKDVKITTAVNARSRFDPPLPLNYTGNCIFNALSTYTRDDVGHVSVETLRVVALGIRASILRHNEDFLRDTIEFITQKDAQWIDTRPGIDYSFGPDIVFTSWANMGMYGADLGAGKPLYVGPPSLPCDGLVIIMEGINQTTGLDVVPFLAGETMAELNALWPACELL